MAKRIGCEVPRIWTRPLRPLNPETSHGFAAIEFAEQVLLVVLMPWQKWLLIHALELLADGSYRFDTVLVLVARQNGKTLVMVLLTLWRMFVDGAQMVVGTAQKLDIAEEAWQSAVDLAKSVDELAAEIPARGGVVHTNGKKQLKLITGERYKVEAATRRGGRGLTADLILLDELREHQSWEAWAAVTNTDLARLRSLIFAFSNAGDATSVVLRALRLMALWQDGTEGGEADRLLEEWAEGTDAASLLAAMHEFDDEDDDPGLFDQTLAIFEWSAAPGRSKWDRDQWAQANPALGHTITEKKLAGKMRKPDHVCRPENLCEWVSTATESPFGPGAWERCADPDSAIPGGERLGLCVEMSTDRGMVAVGVAGRRADGVVHGEVVANRAGSDWVLPWLRDRLDGSDPERKLTLAGMAVQTGRAQVATMVDELRALCADVGVPFVEWAGPNLAIGTGDMYDLVQGVKVTGVDDAEEWDQRFAHRDQPVLNIAASTARMKRSGQAFEWDPNHSATNIAPLVAVTGAVFVVLHHSTPPEESIYETSRLVVAK